MDVVDEIRLKAFHSHGVVFIANEYRAIDRLYRSEEGCVRRDDCARRLRLVGAQKLVFRTSVSTQSFSF